MADNSKRGFAAMDPRKQREIARKGGQAGSEGKGWHGDSAAHAAAGRKGGARGRSSEESEYAMRG